MEYDRNKKRLKKVSRNIEYTEGQKEALEYLKQKTGVPVVVGIRLAIDEYLETRLPKKKLENTNG